MEKCLIAEWYVSRKCNNCKCNLQIYADNLHYHRNRWTLGIKEEFYTKCACDNKIYVDKKHIKESIRRKVRTNKDVTQSISAISWKTAHVKDKYECICKNCEHQLTVPHDNLRVCYSELSNTMDCPHCEMSSSLIFNDIGQSIKFLPQKKEQDHIVVKIILGAVIAVFSPVILVNKIAYESRTKDQLK